MKSNNSPDGKGRPSPVVVPQKIAEAFAAAGDFTMAFQLKVIYRALGGKLLDSSSRAKAARALADRGTHVALETLEPVYNEIIGKHGEPGRPAHWPYTATSTSPTAAWEAIDKVASNRLLAVVTKRLAQHLRGRRPPRDPATLAIVQDELGIPASEWPRIAEIYEAAMVLYRSDRTVVSYDQGARRRRRHQQFSMVLSHGQALRIPMQVFPRGTRTFEQEPDVYGTISCNKPLRSTSVGVIAYLQGIATHPSRFANGGQYEPTSRCVSTSQGALWQVLSTVDGNGNPGGGGHAVIREAIDQLDGLELTTTTNDPRKLRERFEFAPNLNLESCGVDRVEKDVDDGESVVRVPWSDPRPISRRSERPVHFYMNAGVLLELGVKGDEQKRVYLDPGVWRTLSPASRAIYLETQGRAASTRLDRPGKKVTLWFADRAATRFGLDRFGATRREEIVLSALHNLYKTDVRVTGYSEPWSGKQSAHRQIHVYVHGRSRPSDEARGRLRRADFILQMRAALGGQALWPGYQPEPAGASPPG